MGTNYPAQIDTSQSLPTVVDNQTPVQGAVFNQLRNAVLAIEVALGVQPGGLYTSVASRFNTLEAIVGEIGNVQIAEDLGGTPSSPLVIGLQGRPVSNVGPGLGQVLSWNGIAWIPTTSSANITFGGDLMGTPTLQTVVGIRGYSVPLPTGTNTLLTWSGSSLAWEPAPISFTAGGDLSGSNTSQEVIGIKGIAVPTPTGTNTVLTYNAGAYSWGAGGGGGGGTLSGDVAGPAATNQLLAVQGLAAYLPASSATLNEAIVTSNTLVGAISAFYLDSTTNLLWMSQWSSGSVVVMNTLTQELAYVIQTPLSAMGRRIAGDSNYVYVGGPNNSSSTGKLVPIISKTSFTVVGLLAVTNSLTKGSVRDLATDGSGNLYVTDTFNGTICKFSAATITAALASYPTPQLPDITQSPSGSSETCCYDAANNLVWMTDFSRVLYQLDTSLNLLNQATFTSSHFNYFHGLIAYQGYIWAGSHSSGVVRIDPSSFPSGFAFTLRNTTAFTTGDIYIDPFSTTILVQDAANNPHIIRLNAPAGTVASTITFPGGPPSHYYSAAIPSSSSLLWVSDQDNSGVYTFTNTVGSESEITLLQPLGLVYGSAPGPTSRGNSLASTYYIDPGNVSGLASDSNNGTTVTTPFASITKMNSVLFNQTVSSNLTLNFLSSAVGTGLDFSTILVTEAGYITVSGLLSLNYSSNFIHTGTLTGVTAMNPSTNTLQSISDSGFDFGSYTNGGYLILDTQSGPNYQNVCWLAQYSGVAPPSPDHSPTTSPVIEADFQTQGAMSIGDTYALLQPITVVVASTGTWGDSINWQGLTVAGILTGGKQTINQCYLNFPDMFGAQLDIYNCFVNGISNADFALVYGGVINEPLSMPPVIEIGNDVFVTTLMRMTDTAVKTMIVDDTSGGGTSGAMFINGILVQPGCEINLVPGGGSGALLWGTHSTAVSGGYSYGIGVMGGTVSLLTTQPILTATGGGSSDFAFYSTPQDAAIYTTYRSWDESSGTWSSPISCTWSNLFTGGTSFGNAHDVSSGGKIISVFD
jgi:hypothetical protein